MRPYDFKIYLFKLEEFIHFCGYENVLVVPIFDYGSMNLSMFSNFSFHAWGKKLEIPMPIKGRWENVVFLLNDMELKSEACNKPLDLENLVDPSPRRHWLGELLMVIGITLKLDVYLVCFDSIML